MRKCATSTPSLCWFSLGTSLAGRPGALQKDVRPHHGGFRPWSCAVPPLLFAKRRGHVPLFALWVARTYHVDGKVGDAEGCKAVYTRRASRCSRTFAPRAREAEACSARARALPGLRLLMTTLSTKTCPILPLSRFEAHNLSPRSVCMLVRSSSLRCGFASSGLFG